MSLIIGILIDPLIILNHRTPFHLSSLLVQTQRDGLDGLMYSKTHNKLVNHRKVNQIGVFMVIVR